MRDPLAEDDDNPGGGDDDKPGNGRESIADRAARGEAKDPEQPLPGMAPLEGDKQLTLGGLGPRSLPIEAEVSLMSAAVGAKGLIDPNRRGQLLVSYLPAGYIYVPAERAADGTVKRWKLRMQLRPVHIVGGDNPLKPFIAALLEEGVDAGAVERAAKKMGPLAEDGLRDVLQEPLVPA